MALIKYEKLDRVDGSARFGFDDRYQALASMSGPIEVRLANEQASKATVEVSVRPYSGIAGIESKRLASQIHSILTSILILTTSPRTLIQLVIQSLVPQTRRTFSPTLRAACVNAAMLAVLNASSVPMRAIVCAVAVRCQQSQVQGQRVKKWVLNPSVDGEGSEGSFVFMFGGDDSEEETIWTDWTTTNGDSALLNEAREVARKGSREIYKSIKASISSSSNIGTSTAAMEVDQ